MPDGGMLVTGQSLDATESALHALLLILVGGGALGLVLSLAAHGAGLNDAAFNSDGRRIVTASRDAAEARVDFLNGMALAAEALRAAGRGEHDRADELGRSASDSLRRSTSIDLMLPEDEG